MSKVKGFKRDWCLKWQLLKKKQMSKVIVFKNDICQKGKLSKVTDVKCDSYQKWKMSKVTVGP